MAMSRGGTAWALHWSLACAAICFGPQPISAQQADDADEKPRVEFPTTWANGGPITTEALRGKAAFLYFFEESCPRCRDRWPMLFETAAKYADQPIVFIAISSGTTRPEVEQYARSVNLTWPVIVDTDRSFERQADMGEISLQNVMQAGYLTPEGELRHGDWSKIDETIRRALEGRAMERRSGGYSGRTAAHLAQCRVWQLCRRAAGACQGSWIAQDRDQGRGATAFGLRHLEERSRAVASRGKRVGSAQAASLRALRCGCRAFCRLPGRRESQHRAPRISQRPRAETRNRLAQAIRKAARARQRAQAGCARESPRGDSEVDRHRPDERSGPPGARGVGEEVVCQGFGRPMLVKSRQRIAIEPGATFPDHAC